MTKISGNRQSLDFDPADLTENDTLRWDNTAKLWKRSNHFGTLHVSALNSITDVNAAALSDRQVLEWVNANSKWEPKSIARNLAELDNVDPTTPTNDQVLTWRDDIGKWVPRTAGATGASYIDNLLDVDASTPVNNDILMYNSTTEQWVAQQTPGHLRTLMGYFPGLVAVGVLPLRIYNPFNSITLTIERVYAAVNTAPSGASLNISFRRATTEYSTVSISSGGYSGLNNTINASYNTITAGNYLTFNVTQIGSTTPGSDLTVYVVVRGG
jgi:hypothetical protein